MGGVFLSFKRSYNRFRTKDHKDHSYSFRRTEKRKKLSLLGFAKSCQHFWALSYRATQPIRICILIFSPYLQPFVCKTEKNWIYGRWRHLASNFGYKGSKIFSNRLVLWLLFVSATVLPQSVNELRSLTLSSTYLRQHSMTIFNHPEQRTSVVCESNFAHALPRRHMVFVYTDSIIGCGTYKPSLYPNYLRFSHKNGF